MKTIKYRAWHKERQKYYEVFKIVFTDYGLSITLYDEDNIEEQYIEILEDEVILEQFTGLYDKNGKEIYSGDIVEATYNEKKWKYVIATEWKGYYGIFQLLFYVNFKEEFDDVIFGDFYFKVGETHDNFGFATVSYYEVIGNIHENKDLLKE